MNIKQLMVSVAFLLSIFSVSSVQAIACDGDEAAAAESSQAPKHTFVLTEAGPTKATFRVSGIVCKSCEGHVQSSLKQIPGVKAVTFEKSPAKDGGRIAQVLFAQGSNVTPETLGKAFKKFGYQMVQ